MEKNDDALWKALLEEVFDDLLRFVFPNADAVYDMDRGFTYLDKELTELEPEPGKGPDTRFVDKLVKAYTRDGGEEWMLIHAEIQGYSGERAFFPERMYQYQYRIYDRFRKPITAIAIFTGTDGKLIPDRFSYRLQGTYLLYRYNTFCITDPTDEELKASDNPFALVVLAAREALRSKKIPEIELLNRKLMVARLLLGKTHISHRKIGSILFFLRNIIVPQNSEYCCIFDQQINSITGKSNTMGFFEVLAEIRAEEATEKQKTLFVRNLLNAKTFSHEEIASLADVSLEFIEEVREKMKSGQKV
ncbi:hypothetical protein [Dinghuibacter silviterrae]|uniref:Transposase/invertase (TIGR01784 family) n=1 Tax=Dinghuibacter silviterrae TaxID=1539049 RepID=A0A4R8DS60_9BACT|nr:hypothetical protein [Dinghuibacter silviterrae]TDX01092.1 hypothetical protein EDB95_2123 [Dinghuibacter silviterrae]